MLTWLKGVWHCLRWRRIERQLGLPEGSTRFFGLQEEKVPIVETDHYWELPIERLQVTQIRLAGHLTLEFNDTSRGSEPSSSSTLSFSEFQLSNAAGELWMIDPETASGPELAPLLQLLWQHVKTAIAHKSGRLEIQFQQGQELIIDPDARYEAWEVTGPKSLKLVAMPGGEVAIWT